MSERASLLSSLVSGVGERSVGAAMENLQLTAYVAPGCCAALKLANIPCVIGKSMLFRRSELRELGGLALVKDSLAEEHAGDEEQYTLVLANPPFAGSLDYENTAKDLQRVVKTKKTELLFLALFLRLLRPGGRAAVIVPV